MAHITRGSGVDRILLRTQRLQNPSPPAGSAPKAVTHQPNVSGELAASQSNLNADTTYDKTTEGSKADVHKGLGGQEDDKKEGEGHRAEIKSATEKEPETTESI